MPYGVLYMTDQVLYMTYGVLYMPYRVLVMPYGVIDMPHGMLYILRGVLYSLLWSPAWTAFRGVLLPHSHSNPSPGVYSDTALLVLCDIQVFAHAIPSRAPTRSYYKLHSRDPAPSLYPRAILFHLVFLWAVSAES